MHLIIYSVSVAWPFRKGGHSSDKDSLLGNQVLFFSKFSANRNQIQNDNVSNSERMAIPFISWLKPLDCIGKCSSLEEGNSGTWRDGTCCEGVILDVVACNTVCVELTSKFDFVVFCIFEYDSITVIIIFIFIVLKIDLVKKGWKNLIPWKKYRRKLYDIGLYHLHEKLLDHVSWPLRQGGICPCVFSIIYGSRGNWFHVFVWSTWNPLSLFFWIFRCLRFRVWYKILKF